MNDTSSKGNASQGRGWYGDSDAHARAGKKGGESRKRQGGSTPRRENSEGSSNQ